MKTKSLMPAATASPPPQFPKTAVICGITPLANAILRYSMPKAFSASVDSCSRIPALSRSPMTGAPIFMARLYRRTIFFACISPMLPPRTEASWL